MKRLFGLAGMLLASSAGAGQPADVVMHATAVATPRDVIVGYGRAAGLICQSGSRHTPSPELAIKIIPSKVKIDDTSKQGMPLAKVEVRRRNGAPYTGRLTLTKNPGGICKLAGMELQLGRDTTKADDYTTFVCTVTAAE